MPDIPFKNRTIQCVQDLSKDEQIYLYNYASKYKQAILNKDYTFIQSKIINSNHFSVYLLFQENSTRTRQSFYSAGRFHQSRVKDMSLMSSSLEKNETFTDTVKTLMGYAEHSCFIIRSGVEGVCKWLTTGLRNFSERNSIEMPFCINAGDGMNEHPTQEFLDEFTFMEYYKGQKSHIHIALIGDLLHGRTIHSKIEGLCIFDEVEVDLIAPNEIGLPMHYIDVMKKNGFHIRLFDSIEEYISQEHMADIWYFTRLQRERVADALLPYIERIHSKIRFQTSYMGQIPEKAKFFHPLPRDKTMPTIPYELDDYSYNGWEQQSINGYYVRITLLAMLKGIIGNDFEGETITKTQSNQDFIIEKSISKTVDAKPNYKIGIKPVENGLVIDHIAKGQAISLIWNRIDTMRRIMAFDFVSSHGVYRSHKSEQYKGILSIPNYTIEDTTLFRKLGAISPGCTINVINNSKVVKKLFIEQPPKIYNFSEISCRNPRCISHRASSENAIAEFFRKDHVETTGDFSHKESEYFCAYCNTPHDVNEIWNI